VSEAQLQIARLAGFVLAGGLALGAQRLRPHDGALRGSTRINVALWLLNALLLSAACGTCACAVARWAAGRGVGLLHGMTTPAPVAALLTVAVLDLVSYGWHRANHRVALLWRFHQVHHSDPNFTVSTGVRFHPGELLLSLPLRLSAVALLGASPGAVVLFEVVFTLANLFEHGNIDLPLGTERRLAALLVTPALHRRHHTRRYPELDSNFGTIFTLWDRWLGTYGESSSAARIDTGLPNGDGAPSVAAALLLPLRARSQRSQRRGAADRW